MSRHMMKSGIIYNVLSKLFTLLVQNCFIHSLLYSIQIWHWVECNISLCVFRKLYCTRRSQVQFTFPKTHKCYIARHLVPYLVYYRTTVDFSSVYYYLEIFIEIAMIYSVWKSEIVYCCAI